ncbi:hypothetical protein LJR161_004405 [Variovorax paradoxus]|uniref:hypothetical protein n=1 Tax=Variovorax paradoxus TaxID=34073 RepID=UPI003ECC73CD
MSGRDYTQYMFAGATTGKGRLVLALVKRYASDHPTITFDGLRAAFPDSLQADSPSQFDRMRCVVCRVADVPEESRRRFFMAEEECIQLPNETAVVSREWNLHNVQNVLALAEQLGYRVTIYTDV